MIKDKSEIRFEPDGVKILSLFDGVSCGLIAMLEANVKVACYDAFEIDKYAIQTSKHNFPMIEHHGDVFAADFTKYQGYDYLIGGSPCFTKGHLVLTDKGYKDISEVQIGDMVLTHKGRFRPVTQLYEREAETVDLKITGYPNFRTTSNHPFYTISRRKTSYQEYKKNNTWRVFSESEWTPAEKMNKNTFCGMHLLQDEISDINIDDETLWLLGRYIADGHVRKTKRANRDNSFQYQMIISVGEHKLESFRSHIQMRKYNCYKHSQSVYRCCFSSQELVDYIIDNNFGRSAVTKRIPEMIMRLPNERAKIFIDGYMSGDGSVDKKWGRECACTVSKELAISLQRLISRVYKTNVSVSLHGNRRESHKINGREIHANYPLYVISFKRNIPKQSVAHIQDNIIWTQFKSIASTGMTEKVYNIEVEEDHSYTVNNCIVHNCTHWSIAQTKNRETMASGIGWDLFSQYVRALNEAKPKYFIYENNKSMSKEIRASIDATFGFEAICINSALVSAQNRQRLYWVGKRNEDGTYSKVDISQPGDRGILLGDILETSGIRVPQYGNHEKSRPCLVSYSKKGTSEGSLKNDAFPDNPNKQVSDFICEPINTTTDIYDVNDISVESRRMIAEPINITTEEKSQTIKAQYEKTIAANICCYTSTYGATGIAEPVGETADNKAFCLTSRYYKGFGQNPDACIDKHRDSMVAEPCCMRYERTDEAKACRKAYESHEIHHGYHELCELQPRNDGKSNTLSTVLKDNPICEPVGVAKNDKAYTLSANYYKAGTNQCNAFGEEAHKTRIAEPVCVASRGRYLGGNGEAEQHLETRQDGKTNTLTTVEKDNRVAEPIQVGAMPRPNGELSTSQGFRIYSVDAKSVTCKGNAGGADGKTGLYAVPCEWSENGNPTKAISVADGKAYTVYKVEDGQITIKEKTYPIKLIDGYYIIRKLTVKECMRLQTVPEWYEFPVSNSQAYKMLGNGWTCEVIKHLILSTIATQHENSMNTI